MTFSVLIHENLIAFFIHVYVKTFIARIKLVKSAFYEKQIKTFYTFYISVLIYMAYMTS